LNFLQESLTTFVIVFATLFPVINPLGGAPIFLNLADGCSQDIKDKLAKSISINSFLLLLGAMVIGPSLLLFFGISLPILKIGGGIVVAAMGWNLLNEGGKSSADSKNQIRITDATASSSAFYPLTLPLTVGPGSIATVIALVADQKKTASFHIESELSAIAGAILGIIAVTFTIYIAYREASGIQRVFGVNGTNVLMRLFAFILFTIGLQIIWGGVDALILNTAKTLSS